MPNCKLSENVCLEIFFGCIVDHEVANRPYHINVYDICT